MNHAPEALRYRFWQRGDRAVQRTFAMKLERDLDLDLFFGSSSDAVTHVYARARRPDADARWQLTGRIVGPFCRHARTLATTASLVDLGDGPTLLARAVIADLATWSPEHPHLYRVRVELRADDQVADVVEREWGARRFGTLGRDFRWDGKRCVLRGIAAPPRDEAYDAWRELAATAVIESPDDELCASASREGVRIVAVVPDASSAAAVAEVRRLARWPAVLAAWLLQWPDAFRPSRQAPNLVCIASASATIPPSAEKPHGIVCREEELSGVIARHPAQPVLVFRRYATSDLGAARKACDQLQADLAEQGQFAAYLVGPKDWMIEQGVEP